MKRTIVILVITWQSQSMALTYLGAPTTDMDASQIGVSARYSWAKMDYLVGDQQLPAELKTQSALAGLHIGLDDQRAELFALGGAGRLEDATNEASFGGGFRVTTNMDTAPNVDWGIVGSTVFYQGGDTITEADFWDMQLAFGPCWRPRFGGGYEDTGLLYGGPMVYFVNGDGRLTGTSATTKIRSDSWLGVYVGGGVSIIDNHLEITAEVQATPDGWGYGGGLLFRF